MVDNSDGAEDPANKKGGKPDGDLKDGVDSGFSVPGKWGHGSVKVYTPSYAIPEASPAEWRQMGADLVGENEDDHSGSFVSLSADGNVVAIGAYYHDDDNENKDENRGHVRVYRWDETSRAWHKMGKDIDGEPGDQLGTAIDLSKDGTVLAVGAYNHDAKDKMGEKMDYAGRVQVYDWKDGDWQQRGDDLKGES